MKNKKETIASRLKNLSEPEPEKLTPKMALKELHRICKVNPGIKSALAKVALLIIDLEQENAELKADIKAAHRFEMQVKKMNYTDPGEIVIDKMKE